MSCRVSFAVCALLLLVTDLSVAGGKAGSGTVTVRGHVRKDGTYVPPHHRTAPDGNFQNNWSTYGNYNPYTGEEGKVVAPPSRPLGSSGATYAVPLHVPTPPPATPRLLTPILPPHGSLSPPESTPRESPSILSQPDALPFEPLGLGRVTPTSRPVDPSIAATARPLTYGEQQKQRDAERAQFWAKHGYSFNPGYMTAYSMDQKVKDIERAKFWQSKGYSFNPEYMTAYSMDQKVKDIERAMYWQQRGYTFSPEYMTAYSMDQKVRDIERARYWSTRGLNFDPNYMTAYSMDREAERRGVSPR